MVTFLRACLVTLAFSASTLAFGVEINDLSSVERTIKDSTASVVAFHSDNCGTCKIQRPRLQALLRRKHNSKITDMFLNFDSEKVLRKKLNVSFPSTVVIFKRGKEVGRVTGETNEAKLQELLDKGHL